MNAYKRIQAIISHEIYVQGNELFICEPFSADCIVREFMYVDFLAAETASALNTRGNNQKSFLTGRQ